MFCACARPLDTNPLPRGEGAGLVPAGEGSLRLLVHRRPNRLPYFAHELLGMFQHHPIRNPQQTYAKSSQIILFCSVFPHLAGLRVNTAIKFDRQPLFEAVEIEYANFKAELTAKFRALAPAAQQVPRGFFSFSWAAGNSRIR